MLAPKGSEIAGEELDELATSEGGEGEEGAPESGVPAGGTYFPSSMGLSFVVAVESKDIVIEAEWGQYLRIKSEAQQNKEGNPANAWKRQPVAAPAITLPLQDGNIAARPLHPTPWPLRQMPCVNAMWAASRPLLRVCCIEKRGF